MNAIRKTVLLTGFGPFPGVVGNVTQDLVPAIAREAAARHAAHTFHTDVMTTAWASAPARAAALVERFSPVLALHFGVAREAKGFRIERVARNHCRNAEDVEGTGPLAPRLLRDGPEFHPVSIDVAKIVHRLARLGLPVEFSDDAGAYLCNAVLYHSLAAARAREQNALGGPPAPCRTGFIHLPVSLETPPMTFSAALAGSLAIIDACLED